VEEDRGGKGRGRWIVGYIKKTEKEDREKKRENIEDFEVTCMAW